MIKVAMASLGCAKNLVDSENMLGMIKKAGLEIIDDESMADVIIVNTCCFINDAKQESIDTILDVAQWKIDGNCKRLIVTGCLAQRYKDEIIKELPEVDAVLGVGEMDKIIEIIKDDKITVNCDSEYKFCSDERVMTTPFYTGYLKIADGCDNHCTYCVIPSIRGKFQSRPIDELITEATKMAENGVRELVVIAQDTTYYGTDIYGEPKLAELLKKLCEIEGLKWIRVHYCYPERITDELIDVIANEDKICKYLDIPIQHCNNTVLKRMGRKSDKESLENLISKLREKINGLTIRTTVITGFPGETEEQFEELLDFIRKMEFERLGAFAYSCEEETPAALMDGQIDEDEKQRRLEALMLTQDEIAEKISSAKIGKEITVLTEGYDDLVKQHYGRSEADSLDIDGKVFFKSKKRIKEGEFVKVKVDNFFDYDLFGNIVLED